MKHYKYVERLTRCEHTRDPRVSFVSVTLCSASTFVPRPGLLPCLVSGVRNHHHPDHHPDELWSTHDKTSNIQPSPAHTRLVTHVLPAVMGQHSSEKERFYPPCKSNFCRFNFTKIDSNFPTDLRFGHLSDYKITPLPQFMVPCSSLQAAAACSNIFFSSDLQFSAAVYCPNCGRR